MVLLELSLTPTILLGCVYVPPASSDLLFNLVCTTISCMATDKDVLLVWDFNAPDVDWKSFVAPSKRSQTLCDVICDKNLVQLVTESTHIHGNLLGLALNYKAFESMSSVNLACKLLMKILSTACQNFIPEVTITASPSPVWFNGEVRHWLK